LAEPLTQMIEALGLEVAAIRRKGGGTRIELRGGEPVGQAEGRWLYRFVVAEDLNLRDDTPSRVTAGQEDGAGVLVSFRDGVLLAALEKDFKLGGEQAAQSGGLPSVRCNDGLGVIDPVSSWAARMRTPHQ
jgi:hypothetical protein